MQTKLIEILSVASAWMTAAEIADKGGWRSPANVGVALQQMEKANGNVERRKSATKKQGNGMPATEWKLTEKSFDEPACVQKNPNSETQATLTAIREMQKPIERRAVEIAVDRHNEAADLRAKLSLAEKQRDDHFAFAESLQAALEKSDAKLGLLGTMLINIEGDGIEDKLGKVLHERQHSETKISDLEDDVRRHTEAHNRLSTEISHFLTTVQQLTGIDHRPINLAESEEQMAAALNMIRGRIEELELAVDVAQQAVASMELEAEQKAKEAQCHKSENVALKTLNEAMPGFGAVHQAISEGPFVVRTPSKPPRFTKKQGNAHAVAMSAARQHGFAEVFALVPVGKAVRGAEWKSAK